MSPWRLRLWYTMIQVGAGWWFLDQGGYVPGFGLNKTVPPLERNQSQNDIHVNGTSEVAASRTWWFWEGSLPWWTTADPNAGPSPCKKESPLYEGWFVGGFRLFAWVGGARVFSTPEEGGSLTTQGGWLLFIMDTCSVWINWWPIVGATSCLAVAICLLGLTAWSLQVLSHLWCCQCLQAGCRRIWTGEGAPHHQFEETPQSEGSRL